ncbi:MAG: type II toxin-antitoxin system RelE/ParE family toxin [Deltaproteobacteria bacterium]
MTVYRLVIKKSVAKDLRPISQHDVGSILKRIESLAAEPRPIGCEKLSEDDKYRVRQGAYRIIREIQDKDLVVVVVKVGHRNGIYGSGH